MARSSAASRLPCILALTLSAGAPTPAASTPPASASTPSGPAVTSSVDPEVLALREAAWRAWFAGDTAALGLMLPPEFLSFSTRGDELPGKAETLAASRAFKESGGRLVSLSFPRTEAQTYGDVVILYSLYEAHLADASGKETTLEGRVTEVFVRRDGRWLHPGWHLDTDSSR
jgi:ketosteroid isomerase-like protein